MKKIRINEELLSSILSGVAISLTVSFTTGAIVLYRENRENEKELKRIEKLLDTREEQLNTIEELLDTKEEQLNTIEELLDTKEADLNRIEELLDIKAEQLNEKEEYLGNVEYILERREENLNQRIESFESTMSFFDHINGIVDAVEVVNIYPTNEEELITEEVDTKQYSKR